jgi:hypothetical protein
MAGVRVTSDTLDRSGIDEESDPRLQARNSSKWSQLTEFELIGDRVENIALNVSSAITAVGLDDQNPRGAGTFDVYLAGLDATAGSEDVTAAQAAFDARVMGSGATPKTCMVYAAPEAALNLVGTVYYSSNFTASAVQSQVEAALVAFIRTVPLGGFDFSPGPSAVVPKNDIEAVISTITINGIRPVKTVVLTTPTGNHAVPSFGKVTRGTWSLTYVAVNG